MKTTVFTYYEACTADRYEDYSDRWNSKKFTTPEAAIQYADEAIFRCTRDDRKYIVEKSGWASIAYVEPVRVVVDENGIVTEERDEEIFRGREED